MKQFINEVIKALVSIRSGFLFAVAGTIAQTFHTYNVIYDISSIPEPWRTIQAIIVAFFLSGALLYYTVKAGSVGDGAENYTLRKKYNNTANFFAVFESFINIYYWSNKIILIPLLIENQEITPAMWYKMIPAMVFAIAIPVVLKHYAGDIDLKQLAVEGKDLIASRTSRSIIELQGEVERLTEIVIGLIDQNLCLRKKLYLKNNSDKYARRKT